MFILDDNNETVRIDSINQPILTTHFWVLDLPTLDFKLAPLVSLEQVTCPTLELDFEGVKIALPASWNILVYDEETLQMDVVPLAETAGRDFKAFSFGPKLNYPVPVNIAVTNYSIEMDNVGPLFSKQQMLCHSIAQEQWVCVSPADGYNKFLKDLYVGSVIS